VICWRGLWPCSGNSGTPEAPQAGCGSGGGYDLEDIAGQERQNGQSEDGGGLVGEDPEPGSSAKENEQAAGSSGKQSGRESAAGKAAAEESGEGSGEGIGEQVAAGGSEEME
jgi:hypothetical protein